MNQLIELYLLIQLLNRLLSGLDHVLETAHLLVKTDVVFKFVTLVEHLDLLVGGL